MSATTEPSRDLKTLALDYIEAVGRKDLGRVADLLHPDVQFTGPGKPLQGSAAYLAALSRLGPVIRRNDVHKVVAEGSDACVFYDFVTDTEVGSVPSAEWLTFDGERIRRVHLVFHTQPWAKVVEELTRRSAGGTPAPSSP